MEDRRWRSIPRRDLTRTTTMRILVVTTRETTGQDWSEIECDRPHKTVTPKLK